MVHTTAIAFLMALVVAASGCGGGGSSTRTSPPPSIAVSISPSSVAVPTSGIQTFTATVSNDPGNKGVTGWALTGTSTTDFPPCHDAGCGTLATISPTTVRYTAPASLAAHSPTVRLSAISVADPTKSGAAAITIAASSTTGSSAFTPVGSMSAARSGHTATLLMDAKVLIAGGADASAELFDSVNETFAPTGSMSIARSGATAALLFDGKVLIAGGSDSTGASLASAETFNPATGSFSSTGDMTRPRSGATATVLPSGKVLIAGGVDNTDALLDAAELYDPTAGTFTATAGNMTSARWFHTATLLANGKVLLAGGRSSFTPNVHSVTAELFDPFTATFAATGSMTNGRDFHTATLLPNGKVLMLGGNSFFSISSGELYNPASGTFTVAGNLNTPRHFHAATLLTSGKALVVGGINEFPGQESPEFSFLGTVELFDTNSTNSTFTGGLGTPRFGHTATLLNNGQVLVTGGSEGFGGTALATAEIYK